MSNRLEPLLKALANEKRLLILRWLADPLAHFPPQRDGDLLEDGVCGVFIVYKLGVAQPTASEHLRVLVDAGLIRPKKIKQWTFYRRCEDRLAAVPQLLSETLGAAMEADPEPRRASDGAADKLARGEVQ